MHFNRTTQKAFQYSTSSRLTILTDSPLSTRAFKTKSFAFTSMYKSDDCDKQTDFLVITGRNRKPSSMRFYFQVHGHQTIHLIQTLLISSQTAPMEMFGRSLHISGAGRFPPQAFVVPEDIHLRRDFESNTEGLQQSRSVKWPVFVCLCEVCEWLEVLHMKLVESSLLARAILLS